MVPPDKIPAQIFFMALLSIKAIPNAKRSEVIAWEDDGNGGERLKIKLSAPANGGKANQEVIRFLTKSLGIPKSV